MASLELQQQLHDDGLGLVQQGVAAQARGDAAAAADSFAQAQAVFERAVGLEFAAADKQAAAPRLVKLLQYVDLLKARRSPTTVATHSDVNILDMAKLPPRFERIRTAYSSVPGFDGRDIFDALQGVFGFQPSNVANQREHVTLLLANFNAYASTAETPDALDVALPKFHARLFTNYSSWCKYVGEKPRLGEPVVDIALFFLMWGEAGNFRQTPELLCWLFHHLVQDAKAGGAQDAGHFLDAIVRPMYLELQKENDKKTPLGTRAPHTEIRNYDDFNEFFWSKKCLKYTPLTIAEAFGSVDKKGWPNVVTKTFMERRSWMRALWSFRRIFLTNFLLFLATVTFALNIVFLCPDNPIMYSAEMPADATVLGMKYSSATPAKSNAIEYEKFIGDASAAALATNCNIPKLSTCLGIPALSETTFKFLPSDFKQLMADVPFTHCLDQSSGRCSCYLSLLDFCFSQQGAAAVITKSTDEDEGAANLVVSSKVTGYDNSKCLPQWRAAATKVITERGVGYLNCGTCQWSPKTLGTALPSFGKQVLDMSGRPDKGPLMMLASAGCIGLLLVWQIQNRLFSGIGVGYVGRSLYVPWGASCRYTCFWMLLLACKMIFDYRFMVKSLVETTLFIWLSDQTEYLKVTSFMLQIPVYHIGYIFFLWLPAVIVFMYDAQIFYAVFSVFYGSILGFRLKIGELRSFSVLRAAFARIPKVFNKKMVANLIEPPKDKKAKKAKKDLDAPVEPVERRFKTIEYASGATPITIKTAAYSSLLEQDALSDRATEVLSMDDMPKNLERAGSFSSSESSLSSSLAALDAIFGVTGPTFERTIPFAMAWNRCLASMREADVLSHRELSVLSYLIDTRAQRLYTPVFLTAGKLTESINIVLECSAIFTRLEKDKKKDKALEKVQKSMLDRLQKDPLRLQAIYGSYVFSSKVLKLLVGDNHMELHTVFNFIEETIVTKQPLKGLVLTELPAIRTTCAQLMQTIVGLKNKTDVNSVAFARGLHKVVDTMDSLLGLLKKVVKKQDHLIVVLNAASTKPDSFFFSGDGAASRYPGQQLLSLLQDEAAMDLVARAAQLLTVDNVDAEPRSEEGQRRLRFFANSLFMAMPDAKSIEQMHSFSIATPYFNEIVLFSLDELTAENDDNIKLLYYLQTIHPFEWTYFLERVGVADTAEALAKVPEEVQLWASYRGQTLARTVRGMMYHEESIRFLAWLEVGENEPMHGRGCRCNRCLYLDEMVALKFSYVCTCQIYGVQKANNAAQAKDIDFLMRRHPGFRVAYVDKQAPPKPVAASTTDPDAEVVAPPPTKFFSVLLRAVGDLIVEVYRVELPGNPIVGEGKPENQNHAVIFTRGEFVQCIDMNQDGYFEECLKMPNLMATVDDPKHSPKAPLTIIGFREYVFTGGVSNLANFMQIQELSFVSLGQRMLATFHVRQHYGHPDIFDKMFAMTTGGTAKSSKGINLSEDIFAGFNTTLRGGRVSHEEFIQVGKGRDVGMQQLALFEAKLSSGAGECVTSRDAMRMANRLDFFRLHSWFYGNLGWYFTQTMTVFAIYAFIYGKMYFCLSGLDKFFLQSGRMGISGVLNTSWALQFGFLLVVPVIAVIGVERGFRHGFHYLLWNIMTLGPLFFTFQMGNRMHYFDRTLIHGGAKYRATGRGFTIKHEKFAELYRFYAFSHFYRGVELMFLLVLFALYGTFNWCNCSWQQDIAFYNGVEPLPFEWQQRCYANWYQQCVLPTNQNYGIMSYSLWIIAATWVWSPFVFNPSAFDWDLVFAGYNDWQDWLQTKNDSAESWYGWWTAELEYLEYSTPFSRFVTFVRKTRFLLVAFGLYLQLMYRLFYADRHLTVAEGNPVLPLILASGLLVFLVLFGCAAYVASRVTKKMTMKQRRLRKIKFNLSALALVATIAALMYISITHVAELLVILLLVIYWFLQYTICRLKQHHVVMMSIAKGFDIVIGWIVYGPVLFLAMFMPFLAAFQQRIMFNSDFSSGLEAYAQGLEASKLLGTGGAPAVAPADAKPKAKTSKKKKTDEPTPTQYGAI